MPQDPPVHHPTVHAGELRRFGLRLAAVQHQIDRALAQRLLGVSPYPAKVFPFRALL
jgi:hypothetical protein